MLSPLCFEGRGTANTAIKKVCWPVIDPHRKKGQSQKGSEKKEREKQAAILEGSKRHYVKRVMRLRASTKCQTSDFEFELHLGREAMPAT